MTSAGTPRWLALLGIVLALALPAVLIACGGDSPDADGERATATPRTEATETGGAEPVPTRQGIFDGTGSQPTLEPEATPEPSPKKPGSSPPSAPGASTPTG